MRGSAVSESIGGFGRAGLSAWVAAVVAFAPLTSFAQAPAPAQVQPQPQPQTQSNAIESVIAVQQGSTTVLRIQLKVPPKGVPPTFSVANPPRLALDLGDTGNGTGQNVFEIGQGDIRTVNVVQSGGRSRVVMNLRRPVTHQATLDGNAVVVTMQPVASVVTQAASISTVGAYNFAKAEGSERHALRDIDFRRGKENEGRIVVELADARTGVDIKQQGERTLHPR